MPLKNKPSSLFSESSRYTTIIVSLGFATLITLFKDIHSSMHVDQQYLFSFLMLLSIGLFILNEIIGMILRTNKFLYARSAFEKNFNKKIKLEELENKIYQYNNDIEKKYLNVYRYIFGISTGAGFWAGLILIVHYFKNIC